MEVVIKTAVLGRGVDFTTDWEAGGESVIASPSHERLGRPSFSGNASIIKIILDTFFSNIYLFLPDVSPSACVFWGAGKMHPVEGGCKEGGGRRVGS